MTAAFYTFSTNELNTLLMMKNDIDIRVYATLRKSTDFKTGKLEHRTALEITTGKIARLISVPASQGSAELKFERWDVMRSIERLIKAGLIDSFATVGNFLRLRLPLSIVPCITKKNSARKADENTEKSARTLTTPQTLVAEASTTVEKTKCASCQDENDPWSALDEDEWPSETVVAQGFQADVQPAFSTVNPKSTITPLKAQTENQGGKDLLPAASKTQNQPQKQLQTHTAATQLAENPEEKAQINRYRDIVREEGGSIIRYLDTAISRGIYLSWANLKADLRDVREAVRIVLKSAHLLQTPTSIDIVLRRAVASAIKSADCKMRGTGRGSLAL